MDQHPPGGHPDILFHGGRRGADHPAFPAAVLDPGPDGVGLIAVPKGIPIRILEVSHNLLVLGAVAGHHIPVGVDEEGVHAHVAGQEPGLTIDIIDEAVVEIGPEPLFGAVRPQQLVDQVLKVLGDHGPVVDDILGLHKVEAVV